MEKVGVRDVPEMGGDIRHEFVDTREEIGITGDVMIV